MASTPTKKSYMACFTGSDLPDDPFNRKFSFSSVFLLGSTFSRKVHAIFEMLFFSDSSVVSVSSGTLVALLMDVVLCMPS